MVFCNYSLFSIKKIHKRVLEDLISVFITNSDMWRHFETRTLLGAAKESILILRVRSFCRGFFLVDIACFRLSKPKNALPYGKF